MTSRRIVIVSRIFAPEPAAASFRLRALARGLTERGADVTVLTTRPPASTPIEPEPYPVRRWPVLRDRFDYVRGIVQYLSFDVPVFFRLLATRADLVVSEPPPTTGMAVLASSWLRGRPYVWYAPDIWTTAADKMDVSPVVKKSMRLMETLAARRAAGVLTVSEAMGRELQDVTGVGWDKVLVAENGIDTDVFRPDGPVADPGAPYFVYAGSMSEWQGADVFVRAMPKVLAAHPDAQLRFFGRGSDIERVEEIARRLAPGHVLFEGLRPAAETAEWTRGAVAALGSVIPDNGYDFTKPTKIYAAAACGTPVVYAGAGVAAELVLDNGLGAAVAHDPDAVADAMIAALDRRSDPARAAENERLRRERAGWAAEHASLAASGRLAADWLLQGFPD
ncbi:glycosyltransferase family 4 protein [Kocuria sp.]|uniref:glycosyltransferase family 4 protein n=1 Tax=Kocuria sp. TaxID=1871328 RepID=UPI002810CD87|nr:glycosyltransferase family 4 protein [Kocuria sp.]HST72502.1 glycosyltransferase family 4 protein [Kocuria rosea]